MVHPTQDQIFNLIPGHNHLTITETEIGHDDRSDEIDFVLLENTLFPC